MCGIAGLLDKSASRESLAGVAEDMANALRHRGPDDGRVWVDGEASVALAHRRLSVLELSSAGSQPMHSASGRWVIVFNGEVYNHLEIRDRLGKEGHAPAWRGHADTETLLAGVDAWGPVRALELASGMFAIALWDRQERCLWLARDRMGEKPLYYGSVAKRQVFASELKALKVMPGVTLRLNRGALALYLRYDAVPAPHSIYEGIHKVPPGHVVRCESTKGGSWVWSTPEPFWRLAAQSSSFQGSEQEATDELESCLTAAVTRQQLSDVPIGAFLSGGVDSSLVVSLMQRISTRPVRTFTIGSTDRESNEAPHAAAVARHLGTDHTEWIVEPKDALELIPSLADAFCEPFADASAVPTMLVARLAREQVTVALSGDGGDELFAGYNRHLAAYRLWPQLSRLPTKARLMMGRSLLASAPEFWDRPNRYARPLLPKSWQVQNLGLKVQKLATALGSRDLSDFHRRSASRWQEPEAILADGSSNDFWPVAPSGLDPITAMCWRDAAHYLPNDVLVKVDRAAMAASLETRAPLLDPDVVNFAFSLPMALKMREGQGKWLLRQVLYRHVPRDLIERPKAGFGLPIAQWLRGPLREWANDLLTEERLRASDIFKPEPIVKLWQGHQAGRVDAADRLWGVLMFQAWQEVWR